MNSCGSVNVGWFVSVVGESQLSVTDERDFWFRGLPLSGTGQSRIQRFARQLLGIILFHIGLLGKAA